MEQVRGPPAPSAFILGGRKVLSHLFLLFLFAPGLANLPNVKIGMAKSASENYKALAAQTSYSGHLDSICSISFLSNR